LQGVEVKNQFLKEEMWTEQRRPPHPKSMMHIAFSSSVSETFVNSTLFWQNL